MSLHEDNRRAWNEAAFAYASDLQNQIAFLREGQTNFCDAERPILARLLPCQRAIHLQCAGGTDTLSLWKLGASEVVGVDISDEMIAVAQAKSDALGAPATWIRSDVLDTPAELDGTADLVYTGRGALCWLMDLDAWARVAARLLKPGGALFVFEGHPITWLFDLSASSLQLDPEAPYGDYFATDHSSGTGWPETYVGDTVKGDLAVKHERQWDLGHTVNAAIRAGLVIEELGEYAENYWEMYPNWPEDLRRRIPQTFSLVARKP